MALTLNLLIAPALAGVVAGTGAVATYVTSPVAIAPIAAAQSGQPCTSQTWPYLDSKCLASAQQKPVRVVMAPRVNEASIDAGARAIPSVPAPQETVTAPGQAATPSGLITRDTVLRQPDILVPLPKVSTPRAKRSERRQWVAQSYQVPAEARDRGARPVVVVRPLRLNLFR
jgi:hypothetical protein